MTSLVVQKVLDDLVLDEDEIAELSTQFPYFSIVPRDFDANLNFREALIVRCAEDKAFREEQWEMCARDFLYYVSAWVWTIDPRGDERDMRPNQRPFIPYAYQIRALAKMDKVFGKKDMVINKSRDTGASWLILLLFDHRWKFFPGQDFLLLSKNEDLVDKKHNPKSLMWKLDYINKNQPAWMVPTIERTHLQMANLDNGSTISGASTTGDAARGDRRTAIMLDEFAAVGDGYGMLAATQAATNCRIFNSTPRGVANAHHKVWTDFQNIVRIEMYWYGIPYRAEGLYSDVNGKL